MGAKSSNKNTKKKKTQLLRDHVRKTERTGPPKFDFCFYRRTLPEMTLERGMVIDSHGESIQVLAVGKSSKWFEVWNQNTKQSRCFFHSLRDIQKEMFFNDHFVWLNIYICIYIYIFILVWDRPIQLGEASADEAVKRWKLGTVFKCSMKIIPISG